MPDELHTNDTALRIEDDAQTEDETPLTFDGPRRLVTEPRDLSIRELFTQEQDGDLRLQPEFQRFYVFDDVKASRLVESVLMSVPLPLVYLAEETNATYSVIDGQQRLTSFFRFLRNEQRLQRLTILTEYNGKLFRDLPEDMQRAFRNSSIRCIIIKRESHPDIKFEIFERLNTGSVKLNDQELRNCIYRGRFNQLLSELVEDPDWLRLLRREQSDNRMVDREMVLRFFGLYLDYNQYQPPMKRFLNQVMRDRQGMTEAQASQLREVFRRAVLNTWTVFGKRAFIRFEPGREGRPDGTWGPDTRLNMSLFDAVMLGFARYEQREVVPNSDAIREALIDMMATDREFIDNITVGTSQRNRMHARVDMWLNRLREVVNNPQSGPRLFPLAFKERLFEANPTCSFCQQRIMSLDDAAVDHIHPWSTGGATEPANGRLAHRYCNSARGNR